MVFSVLYYCCGKGAILVSFIKAYALYLLYSLKGRNGPERISRIQERASRGVPAGGLLDDSIHSFAL